MHLSVMTVHIMFICNLKVVLMVKALGSQLSVQKRGFRGQITASPTLSHHNIMMKDASLARLVLRDGQLAGLYFY